MRNLLLILVLCPLLILSACGGQDTRKITEGHWTFKIPHSWQQTTPSGERWQQAYRGDDVRLEVAGHLSDQFNARGALGQLSFPAMNRLPSFESQGIENLEVKGGAHEVVVQRYTFTDGGKARAGAWVVGTQWPYPESAAISISTESGGLDEQLLASILDSLKWNATP